MPSSNTALRIKVTIAKDSDRPLVARLCRRAVSKSDYVLRILPTIIKRGGLFLAWKGDTLVGVTNFDNSVDGSGWLSVARTDPDWRGRGVAPFLQRQIAAYAKRRGVNTLRLWVSSDNKPSLRACEKGGFKQICETVHITRTLRRTKRRRKISPSFPSDRQLTPLLKSKYVAKTRGYIGHRRHFVKLTKNLLAHLRDEGELYLSDEVALLVTRPDTFVRAGQSSATILEGPFTRSLLKAQEIAVDMGARTLSAYIPYDAYQISVAKRLGFRRSKWGIHALVFEKRI